MNDHPGWTHRGRCVWCGTSKPSTVCFDIGDDARKGLELLELCESFIEYNEISCPGLIYQTDKVLGGSYQLIESLCNVVGYHCLDDAEDESQNQ